MDNDFKITPEEFKFLKMQMTLIQRELDIQTKSCTGERLDKMELEINKSKY